MSYFAQFKEAAQQKDKAKLKEYLQAGACINEFGPHCLSAALELALEGDLESADFLLQYGGTNPDNLAFAVAKSPNLSIDQKQTYLNQLVEHFGVPKTIIEELQNLTGAEPVSENRGLSEVNYYDFAKQLLFAVPQINTSAETADNTSEQLAEDLNQQSLKQQNQLKTVLEFVFTQLASGSFDVSNVGDIDKNALAFVLGLLGDKQNFATFYHAAKEDDKKVSCIKIEELEIFLYGLAAGGHVSLLKRILEPDTKDLSKQDNEINIDSNLVNTYAEFNSIYTRLASLLITNSHINTVGLPKKIKNELSIAIDELKQSKKIIFAENLDSYLFHLAFMPEDLVPVFKKNLPNNQKKIAVENQAKFIKTRMAKENNLGFLGEKELALKAESVLSLHSDEFSDLFCYQENISFSIEQSKQQNLMTGLTQQDLENIFEQQIAARLNEFNKKVDRFHKMVAHLQKNYLSTTQLTTHLIPVAYNLSRDLKSILNNKDTDLEKLRRCKQYLETFLAKKNLVFEPEQTRYQQKISEFYKFLVWTSPQLQQQKRLIKQLGQACDDYLRSFNDLPSAASTEHQADSPGDPKQSKVETLKAILATPGYSHKQRIAQFLTEFGKPETQTCLRTNMTHKDARFIAAIVLLTGIVPGLVGLAVYSRCTSKDRSWQFWQTEEERALARLAETVKLAR